MSKEIMYKATLKNIYDTMKNNPECKPIISNDEEVYLSVGGFAVEPYLLTIDAHYSSDYSNTITTSIPILESFRNEICINPDFDDTDLILALVKADILSNYYGIYEKDNIQYQIFAVNTKILSEYKPFGASILNNHFKEGTVLIKEEVDKKSLPKRVNLNFKGFEQELDQDIEKE